MNQLNTTKRCQIIAALIEGNSINATCRMLGVGKHTVLRLLDLWKSNSTTTIFLDVRC